MRGMIRGIFPVVLAMLLGACAVPVPLKVASWAIDGISLLTTHKSVADHGLSLVSRQDCAMWRVVKGETLCSQTDDSGQVVVAEVEGGQTPDSGEIAGSRVGGEAETMELAEFETAAGDSTLADPTIWIEADEIEAFEPAEPVANEPGPVVSRGITDLAPDAAEFVDAWAFMRQNSTTEAPASELAMAEEPHTPPETDQTELAEAAAAAGEARENRPKPLEFGVVLDSLKPDREEAWPELRIELASLSDAGPGDTPAEPALLVLNSGKIGSWWQPEDTIPGPKFHDLKDFGEALAAIKGKPTGRPLHPEPPGAGPPPPRAPRTDTPEKAETGLYYVIGSFQKPDGAVMMADRHASLKPKVMTSSKGGGGLTLLVVGPFSPEDKKAVRRRVAGAGIHNSWAARLESTEWTRIHPSEMATETHPDSEDLAELPR